MLKPILAERNLPDDGEARAGSARTRATRRRSVTVNLAESPLGWLYARKLVTDRQFAAGEMLRCDYESAALGSTVTMRWDGALVQTGQRNSNGRESATNAMLMAKARFLGAVEAAGPGLSDILWRVVCAGEAVPSSERALGWPARAGRVILTLALDRVADHYRVM
jgi:hypothetical protein